MFGLMTNFTPKGKMTPALLARHKLPKGCPPNGDFTYEGNRKFKKSNEMTKNYRLFVHGSHEPRLPAVLRNACYYLSIPMAKSDFGATRDDRAPRENENDMSAAKVPLKV